MAKIYYAKLNINEKIGEVYSNRLNLQQLLLKLYDNVTNDVEIKDEKSDIRYKFVNLNKDEKNNTIFGFLSRIHSKHIVDIYDEKENDLEDHELKNYSESVAFSFNVQKEIISFVPNQNFRKEKFIEIFKKMLEKSYENMGYINITLLVDKEKFETKFKSITKLGRFSVVLVPPNDANDIFAKMNDEVNEIVDFIKESNAKYYKQELASDVRNPIKKDSNFVKTLKLLANSGYGYVQVYGRDSENHNVKINTKEDTEMHKVTEINDSFKKSPFEIMTIVEKIDE